MRPGTAEAMEGPGVVVIDAAIFPQRAGLEELLARLPAEGRFIVVGRAGVGESLAAAEIRGRNPGVFWAPTLEEAVPVILSLWAADHVYVLGEQSLAQLLQLYLRETLIQVSQLDLRLGLKVILLALGVPEELFAQLNWDSVESALASLEAA